MPTDNQDDLAAAGLDLTRHVSPDEILSPEQLDEQTLAADLLRTQNYSKQEAVTTGDQTLNIARHSLTGALFENAFTPTFKIDPLFTSERFKERLKEAQKTLPEPYWDDLSDALSEQQFEFLYRRATSRHEAQQEIEGAGFGATSANLLAQLIDPAAWVIGGGIANVAIKSARAYQLGRTGQIAANAVGGASGGLAFEAARDEAGLPSSTENYLLATGLGLSLGALFGPIGRNPAIAHEAAVIHEAGEQMVKQSQLLLPAPPKQITYAGVKRAEELSATATDDVIQVAPEPGQIPARLTPPEAMEAPPAPSAVRQAVDDVSAVLAGEDVNPIPSIQAAADEILNPQAATEAAPSKPSAGLVHEAPDVAAEKIDDLRTRPKLNRDRQRHRQNAVDFVQWRKDLLKNKPKGSAALPEAEPLPGKLGEGPEGYTFRSFLYRRADDGSNSDEKVFTAHKEGDETGAELGYVEMTRQDDGRWMVSMIEVPPEHRKSTSAFGLLKVAEREMEGQPIIPDGTLKPDGYEHWIKRLPWVKDWYRPAPEKPDALWLSPRQLLQNRELIANDIHEATGKKLQKLAATLKGYDEAIRSLPKEALFPDNLAGMFALRDPMAGKVLRANARASVDEVLDLILPANVRRVVDDEIAENGVLDGLYRDRVVYVALNAANPVGIAYHEVGHALKQLGLFADDEWTRLVAEAHRIGADKRYRIGQRYQHDGLTAAQFEEEAVMHMLADRLQGKTFGAIDATLDKVVRVLRQIRDALGVKGFRTTQDLFDDIKSGRVSARSQDPQAAQPMAARSVGAQGNPVVTHDFLEDADWKSVRNGDVPRAAGFWRFDRAGISGQSENAPERLIGPSLLNESVGKADHSLNPFSADQDYRRIMNVYQGEFHKTARPAYQEWADALRLSPAQRIIREHEFFELAGRYMRDRNRQPGDYHPAVARLGDKAAKLHKEILEDLQNPLRREGLQGRAIHGSELVPEDEHYLWRKFSNDKIRGAVDEQTGFSQTGVIRMIAGAIRSAQPGIDNDLVERLAKGYLMNIHSRAVGLGDEWSMALSRGDYDHFHRILTTTSLLTADEADDIIARLSRHRPEGDMANLKRRMFLDETYVERNLPFGQQGQFRDLAFNDILEDNLNNIFSHYLRRASGRIALGRVRVQHPDGSVLINGITSDREIENVLGLVQKWGIDQGQHVAAGEARERLGFAFDRILGIPDPRQYSSMGQWLRLTRAYMSTRLMGQVGIAQLGESGSAVGTLGIRSLFQHVPAFRRVIDGAGDIRNNMHLLEELEAMGIGVERLHGLHYHNLDEVGDLPFEVAGKPRMERVLNNARSLENLTYEASGMSFIQQRQEMWVAANMASKIASMAAKLQAGQGLGRSATRRLAQLGIDEPTMARIMGQMRQHTDATDGMFFGRKVNRLNVDRWTDLEARAALENALFRATKKIIQSGDEGSAAMWMSNPIAQTIFQFRGFAFTAWNNQLLYNIHMGDPAALTTFVASVGWAGAVRAAQVSLLAASRSDGEEFKEKYLTPWELGKAGFQRAGWSSIIPMGVDSALALGGQPGMFNARTTGQASNLVFGNPAMSFLDNAAKGIGGTGNSLYEGRSPSQGEVRQLVGLLPFSNLMPVTTGLSYLIQDLPERSPQRRINY